MISSYDEFIAAAKQQSEPQRLLFVFCQAELPDDASEGEKAEFEQGQGGSLAPVVCVDKLPEEIIDFKSLRRESEATGQTWDLVFVAAMSGRAGVVPSSDEAMQPMNMMVETVKLGHLGNYLAFTRDGELVTLSR